MSDPVTAGLVLPSAAEGDLAEQHLDAVAPDDADVPDMSDITWDSDPADALEQRLEVGVDDGHDQDAGQG